MRRAGRRVAACVADVLYARSDADHRARGWEIRRGGWGGRRYRLDVAAWLDAQLDRAGQALTRPTTLDAAEAHDGPGVRGASGEGQSDRGAA